MIPPTPITGSVVDAVILETTVERASGERSP